MQKLTRKMPKKTLFVLKVGIVLVLIFLTFLVIAPTSEGLCLRRYYLIIFILAVFLIIVKSFLDLRRDSIQNAEDLEEENEYIISMLDSSPLCIQVWDREKTIDCNEAGLKLYGFKDKAEYMERFINDCNPKYQPCGTLSSEKAATLVNEAFRTGYCFFYWEHKVPDSDELIPSEVTLVRIKYKDDYAVLGYTNDIRKRVEAENENKEKTKFLVNMSHEIRTPMNAIVGIAEILMEDETLSDKSRFGLEKILSSSDLLLNIINDILDLSKLGAGKFEIISSQYILANVIVDSMQLTSVHIGSKNIEVFVNIEKNTAANLIGDEIRIKQILNNLLSNAFKYTEDGRVVLSVETKRNESDDESCHAKLIFTVQDTGFGMTAEQLCYLGSMYKRFNNDRKIQGTGLGLNITSQLLELMGGKMSVESEVGKGSKFVVSIPQEISGTDVLCEAHNLSSKQFLAIYETNRRAKRKIEYEQMPYGRVLIVDDAATNLYVAESLMQTYGLQIETADNGKKAIDKIESGQSYDIIFMDHMMLPLDGIETTKILRDLGYDKPIVALTANAIIGQEEIFLKNGFDSFIAKPIDIYVLDAILNKYVRNRHLFFFEQKSKSLLHTDTSFAMTTNPKLFRECIDIELLAQLSDACSRYCMDGVNATMNEIEKHSYKKDSELLVFLRKNIDCLNFNEVTDKIASEISMRLRY